MKVSSPTTKVPSFWMLSLSLASLLAFAFALFIVGDLIEKEGRTMISISKPNNISRKLLLHSSSGENEMKRIGGNACSKKDIVINQAQVSPLPNGIPSYTVEIMNACAWDCSISNIHLHCGWFSSARLVNPRLFRRLGFDDCLVSDGHALRPGSTVSFEYANTHSYPLSVSSLVCQP